MEFKNLDCNILHILSRNRNHSGVYDPLALDVVYSEFSDLPGKNVTAAIDSLEADGFIILDRGERKLALTAAGVARLKHGYPCVHSNQS